MNCKLHGILVKVSCFNAGIVLGYYLFNRNKSDVRADELNKKGQISDELTRGETDNPYETAKSVYEYLTFNYGGPDVNCVFKELRPEHGYDFPKATVDVCFRHFDSSSAASSSGNGGSRALDIGCAVGRASFELAAKYDQVVGIDYSHHFVQVCNELKNKGSMKYQVAVEGDLTSDHIAEVPSHLDSSRCCFEQGDGCNLSRSELGGQFDCVLAGNLICRLPHPKKFLKSLKDLVKENGICVITSPYTFLTDYTNKKNWLGGFQDANNEEVRGFSTMKDILLRDFDLVEDSNLPFLIRETLRKHQWTVAHVTVWKRKST